MAATPPEPGRRCQRGPQIQARDRLTWVLDPQVPARVDRTPHTGLRPQAREIALRNCGELTLLPAIDCHHEMPGKAFDEAFCPDFPKPLVRERRRQRIER